MGTKSHLLFVRIGRLAKCVHIQHRCKENLNGVKQNLDTNCSSSAVCRSISLCVVLLRTCASAIVVLLQVLIDLLPVSAISIESLPSSWQERSDLVVPTLFADPELFGALFSLSPRTFRFWASLFLFVFWQPIEEILENRRSIHWGKFWPLWT